MGFCASGEIPVDPACEAHICGLYSNRPASQVVVGLRAGRTERLVSVFASSPSHETHVPTRNALARLGGQRFGTCIDLGSKTAQDRRKQD
jgi:hypothetical protein